MNSPFFSIIITVYNGSSTITETILSIYNQTFNNFEILIYNDGSTDNTHEILSNLLEKYRFTYVSLPKSGRTQLLNKGLKNAKGAFICICDCDDIWHPQKLEFQYDFLKKNVNVKFVSTLSKTFTNGINFDYYETYETRIIHKFSLWIYNKISHSSICFKNGLIEYPPEIIHDYYIYLTLIHNKVRLYEINSILTYNRIHINQNFESGGWLYRLEVLKMQFKFMNSNRKYIYSPVLFLKLLYYLTFAKARRFFKIN